MLTQTIKKQYLEIAIVVAHKAGKALMKYWGKLKEIREKEHFSNLVTEADKASENIILRELKRNFPGHAILTEETGLHPSQDSEFLWVIDPLDGTTNFSHQFPVFAISIGLMYQNEPVVGVIYDPYFEQLYTGAIDLGAKRNNKKIAVSKVAKLQRSLLATGFAYDRNQTVNNNYAQFCHLTSITHGVRRLGSAALDLAYVASGSLDGFWERGLQPWDICAGAVILKEAGGLLSDYDGSPLDMNSGRVIATNGLIHNELKDAILNIS